MAQRLTSPSEAASLRAALVRVVADLERRDFTRDQIGSAMAGVGLGLVIAHMGVPAAKDYLDTILGWIAGEKGRRVNARQPLPHPIVRSHAPGKALRRDGWGASAITASASLQDGPHQTEAPCPHGVLILS